MAKPDKTDIHRIVQNEIDDAVLYQDEEHTGFRDTATKYFYGEKFGNEVENQSQIVSQALDQDWSVVFHSCRSVVLPIADRKDISWTKPPDMVKPVKNINNWLRTAI